MGNHPIIDSARMSRFASSATWASGLSDALAAIYPSGVLASLADVVENEWAGVTPPSGCASITRHTISEPGGRAGGSVVYSHVLLPDAVARGQCVVVLPGHSPWLDDYCSANQGNLIPLLLAAGYHVLAVDMPNYGLQPLQAVVINGTLSTMGSKNSQHAPSAFGVGPYTGPALVRLYTDHIIRSMNQVTDDLGITDFALVGHSGGGATASLLAPIESRFSVVHLLQGGTNSDAITGVWTEWELYDRNELNTALRGGYKIAAAFSAAFPGRLTVLHSADADEYFLDQHIAWATWTENMRMWFGLAGIAALTEYHRKTTGTHNIDATQAAYVVNHLLANF